MKRRGHISLLTRQRLITLEIWGLTIVRIVFRLVFRSGYRVEGP
jgi:hypothetical protein